MMSMLHTHMITSVLSKCIQWVVTQANWHELCVMHSRKAWREHYDVSADTKAFLQPYLMAYDVSIDEMTWREWWQNEMCVMH
jgi:hypothetical protein